MRKLLPPPTSDAKSFPREGLPANNGSGLIKKPRRKLSGLSGLELQLAYNSLLKLKSTIMYEESEEDSELDPNDVPKSFEQQIDTMLSQLGSKLEGPQVCLELRNVYPPTHTLQSLTFSSMS